MERIEVSGQKIKYFWIKIHTEQKEGTIKKWIENLNRQPNFRIQYKRDTRGKNQFVCAQCEVCRVGVAYEYTRVWGRLSLIIVYFFDISFKKTFFISKKSFYISGKISRCFFTLV